MGQPQSGMSDDQLKRYFDRQDFDPANLTSDEKLRLKTLTEPAAPVTSNAPADDSPIAFARGVGRGAWNQGKTILSGMRDVGSAAWDVGRAAMQDPMLGGSREAARPENAGPGESTIVPMLKGFGSGVVEGAKNLVDPAKWAENQEGFTGVKIAGDQPLSEKLGASAVNIAAILGPAKLASRGMRALRGGGAAAEAPILETASKLGTRTATAESAGSARSGTAFHPGDLPQAPAYKGAAGVGHEGVPPESGVAGAGGRRPPAPPQGPAAPPAGTSTGVDAPPDRGLGAVTEQDRIFEALMDDLHPESEGPLPGNGSYAETGRPKLIEGEDGFTYGDLEGEDAIQQDYHHSLIDTYGTDWGKKNLSLDELEEINSWVHGGSGGEYGGLSLSDETVNKLPRRRGDFYRGTNDIKNEWGGVRGSTGVSPRKSSFSDNPKVAEEFDGGLTPGGIVKARDMEVGDLNAALKTGHTVGSSEQILPGGTPYGVEDSRLLPSGRRQVTIGPNEPGTLGELRASGGAANAAQDPRLRSLESEVGVPMNKDAVRDITGTPSRVPEEVSNKSLDDDFMRHIMDERGSIQFGPSWKKLKESLGFGGPEPEAIAKDPFAMKEGPMGRRQFLYRSSGAPRRSAEGLAKQFAKEGITLPEKAMERIGKLIKTFDGIDPESGDAWAVDPARADKIIESAQKYIQEIEDSVSGQTKTVLPVIKKYLKDNYNRVSDDYLGSERLYSMLDKVDEAAGWDHRRGISPSEWAGENIHEGSDVFDSFNALAAAEEPVKTPSMLEAFTGEIPKEFESAVKEGEAGAATHTAENGAATLDEASHELSFMDRMRNFRKRLSDERGSVSIFPGDDKPNANPKAEAAGDVRKDLAGKRDFSEGLDPARYRFRLWPKEHFDQAGLKTESSVPPASGAKDDISKALDDYAKKVADIKTQEEATKPLPKINLREEPSAADKKSFLGKYGDETGSFSPKALLDGANQLRVASFLSGLAIPKSILGNAGAIMTAALEGGTTKPIRAMGDIRTNFANLKKNWKASANPGAISGAGKLNPPGRIMGAVDQTTQELLERAGVPEDEARRLLLTRNNNAFKELGLSGRAGRAFFPFQRTASNVIKEGFSGENWKGPTRGGSARRTALSLGAMGAGSVLGSNTNDPKILGLAAALAGPRAVPMLIAAAMGGAGKNAVAGLSPIPEWGLPSKPSDLLRLTGIEPAAVRAFGLNTQTGRKGRDDKKTTNRTRKERK